jgi:hypothetical protein
MRVLKKSRLGRRAQTWSKERYHDEPARSETSVNGLIFIADRMPF